MRRALAALLHDQRATALTEFVITLPIFITIFLGITGLAKLQDAATRAHAEANRAMWEQAHESANSEPDSVWGDPAANGSYEDLKPEDRDTFGYDQTKFMRLHDFGTLGEAMSGANFAETKDWKFRLEDGEENCERCVQKWVYGGELLQPGYAAIATNDGGIYQEFRPRVDPEFEAMAALFPKQIPSRYAYGAGSRYGIASGRASREVSWKRWHATFTPQYQVTAPSRTLEEDGEAFATMATARVELERWEWADIPGFQIEDEFDFEFGLGYGEYIQRRH
jgi:hypothetical protein